MQTVSRELIDRLGRPRLSEAAVDLRRFWRQREDLRQLEEAGIPPVMGGANHWTYIVYNSAMATSAAPVKQPTGTAIRTMMQLKPATGVFLVPIAWGCSFDGSAAATPGIVELIACDTGATSLSTAYAAADVQPYGDPNADANTAGTSGVPLNLGTSASGFSTGSVTENAPAVTRMFDVQLIAPTNQYAQQWPLGREAGLKEGTYLRVRATFAASVNMICWIVFEV